jgi:NitT/TauT family transport system ATP-binding protein
MQPNTWLTESRLIFTKSFYLQRLTMFLQINNLHKNFDTKQGTLAVLKDINMLIEQGEFICAVGASGSGKSTLLRQIAGLDLPTTGEVKVDGHRVTGPGPDRGMVFQHYTPTPG